MSTTVTISEPTIEALLKLHSRYYFGVFEQIVTSEDEEYEFRDALAELSKLIITEEKKGEIT